MSCSCCYCFCSILSDFFCCCGYNKNKFKKESNKRKQSIELSNKKSIKILMIGNNKDSELIKVKDYIADYFFPYNPDKKDDDTEIYIISNIIIELTSNDFSLLNYYSKNNLHHNSKNKYDYIFSFYDKKEDHINIIKSFGKCKYFMNEMEKKISKSEILDACSDEIESTDLFLINHFRIRVKKIFDALIDPNSAKKLVNSNKTVSESELTSSSKNDTNDDIDPSNESSDLSFPNLLSPDSF